MATAAMTVAMTTRRCAPVLATMRTTPSTFTTLAGLRRHLRRLQRESRSVARTVAQLKEIVVAQGQAFGWQSAQTQAADETLRYWQNRYRALVGQMALARALYVSVLLAPTNATTSATLVARTA